MSKTIEWGTVELELFDRTVVLTGTPRATFAIDDKLGGAVPAMEALRNFNRKAIATIIEASAKLSPSERARLPEEVCAAPTERLLTACIELVAITLNGGRPIPKNGLEAPLEEAAVEGNA